MSQGNFLVLQFPYSEFQLFKYFLKSVVTKVIFIDFEQKLHFNDISL